MHPHGACVFVVRNMFGTLHAGEGMTELYAALQPVLDEHDSHHGQQVEAQEEEAGAERPVQLAIMGLPNVASVQSFPAHCLPLC